MRNIILLSVICFLSVGTHAQKNGHAAKDAAAAKEVVVGTSIQYDNSPKLTIRTVAVDDANLFANPSLRVKKKISEDDNFFYLQTNTGRQKFEKYKDRGAVKGWQGYEYNGYSQALSLYAVTHNTSTEGLGFGRLILIDAKTGFKYRISSFGDGAVSLPVSSPRGNYLAYYYNADYQHKNADIGLLQVRNNSRPEDRLIPIGSYHADNFAVEQISWQSDTVFVVKGYEEILKGGQWEKQYQFYKVNVPYTAANQQEVTTVKLHGYTFRYKPLGTDTILMTGPNGKKRVLPGGILAENEHAIRRHKIEDYNFDGYPDIAFSVPDQGMGVYRFFDIWMYNPKARTFSQLQCGQTPGSKCTCFCNVEIDKKRKHLLSSCRSGARWWQDVYTFDARGKLKFLKSREAD